MITLSFIGVSYSQDTFLPGLQFGKFLNNYDGMLEQGYNSNPFIDIANQKYAHHGAPYCASGMSMAMDVYNRSVAQVYPSFKLSFAVRSAVARNFIQSNSTDARQVYYNKATAPNFAFCIYKRQGGGHISYNCNGRQFHFNSSSGTIGSQWNGKWSGWKSDNIVALCSPLRAFRITHFTKLS